jgi:putative DNA primase/helicase
MSTNDKKTPSKPTKKVVAISEYKGIEWIHVKKNGNPYPTRENFEALLNHYKIRVHWNDINKRALVHENEILNPHYGDEETELIAELTSKCIEHGLAKSAVSDYLNAHTLKNSVNPVLDYLQSVKRTTELNPIEALVNYLPIKHKGWAEIAFKRWFIQCVACVDMAQQTPNKKALPKYEHVLTFYGEQGCHKSSFFNELLPQEIFKEYYSDGLILNLNDKDSIMESVSSWICELGELDSTFRKSDISSLKAFLSKRRDIIRKPYGKAHSLMPRQTSFVASVNEEKYLRDETGNRRYFPISVIGKLTTPEHFDIAGFWAYIWEEYKRGEQWWLTPEEEEQQKEVLAEHEHSTLKELLLDTFIFEQETRPEQMTGKEILEECGLNQNHSNQTKLGNALKLLSVKKLSYQKRKYLMPKTRKAFIS